MAFELALTQILQVIEGWPSEQNKTKIESFNQDFCDPNNVFY